MYSEVCRILLNLPKKCTICINNICYLSTPTCFDVYMSSSWVSYCVNQTYKIKKNENIYTGDTEWKWKRLYRWCLMKMKTFIQVIPNENENVYTADTLLKWKHLYSWYLMKMKTFMQLIPNENENIYTGDT